VDEPITVSTSNRVNLANWNERAPAHAASPDYGFARFASDPAFLSDVVRFDRPRLGDVSGLRGVHLQCHIGTDTISLQRLGARMTGLDFSAASLAEARRLAHSVDAPVDFVESDVYLAAEVLEPESFDLVYTGIGALCWLPDIARWGRVVRRLLKPGGRLFLREGHPMMWSLDENRPDGGLAVEFAYFERPEPLVYEENGTYVATGDTVFTENVTHTWNHGLSEIMGALTGNGLVITGFAEHDSAPWDAFPGFSTRDEHGEWRLTDRPWRLPQTYTLQAQRPA
jgi:SAM-dependent methyltransferase